MEGIGHLWFEPDERLRGLEAMFEGFSTALNSFVEKGENCRNYYADFYFDETELIYGVVLLSLQNYINKSCVDFLEIDLLKCDKTSQLYGKCSKIVCGDITQIQLIISLANYFKHRDENNKLHKQTEECFRKVDILRFSSKGDERYEDSLITEGLLLLIDDIRDIRGLLEIVKNWKKDLLELCHELKRQSIAL